MWNLLPTRADLEAAFPQCEPLLSQEIEREVLEGTYHTGLASVVQFIAKEGVNSTAPGLSRPSDHWRTLTFASGMRCDEDYSFTRFQT